MRQGICEADIPEDIDWAEYSPSYPYLQRIGLAGTDWLAQACGQAMNHCLP